MSTTWLELKDEADDNRVLLVESGAAGLKLHIWNESEQMGCKFFIRPEDLEKLAEAIEILKTLESR